MSKSSAVAKRPHWGNPAMQASLTVPFKISEEEAAEVTRKMKLKFEEHIETLYGFDGTSVLYIKDRALLELLEDVSEQNMPLILAGLGLMAAFCVFTMISKIVLLPVLSLGGLAIVYLSLNTTYWIMSYLNISTNVTTNSILPFLAIGLGVDDMFILLRMFQKYALDRRKSSNKSSSSSSSTKIAPSTNPSEGCSPSAAGSCLDLTMNEVGRSMTMTSASNFFAFFFASTVPVEAVSSFCKACSVVVLTNYFLMIFLYAPIVGIFERTLASVYLCGGSKDATANEMFPSSSESSSSLPSAPPFPAPSFTTGTSSTSSSKTEKTEKTESHEKVVVHDVVDDVVDDGGAAFSSWYMKPCNFQRSKMGKLIIVLMNVALLCIGAVGVSRLSYGLSIADIAPKDSEEYLFYDAFQRLFSFQPMRLRTGNLHADFPGRQRELLDFVERVGENKYVLQVVDWYLPTALKFISTTVIPHDFELTADGLLEEEDYVRGIKWWQLNDPISSALMVEPYFEKSHLVPEGSQPRQVEGQIEIFLYNLWTTADITAMIEDIEKICAESGTTLNIDDATYDRLSLWPKGGAFTFFEQYTTLADNGLQGAAFAIAGVWVVGVAVAGVYCGTVMALVIAAMMFELVGFIGLAGIKMSALPVVTVLSCIGISVEFVGHVASSFSAAAGSGRYLSAGDRMTHVYTHVYLPVLDGSISTLLAIAMLSQSDFLFVKLYFFYPYVAIVVIGLLNGLLLLPVLLAVGWDFFQLGGNPADFKKEEEGGGEGGGGDVGEGKRGEGETELVGASQERVVVKEE